MYSHIHNQRYKHIIHIHLHMHAESTTHNKDEWDSLLEKYTSHFIDRFVCERELETEQNCNILIPTLLAITAFLSRSPVLLNRGPEGPLCWVLAFSIVSCHQRVWSPKLTDFLSSPSYIIVQRPPSCGRHKLHSFNPSTVKVILSWST